MDPRIIREVYRPYQRQSTQRYAGARFSRMLSRMHLIPLPRVPQALRNRVSPEIAFLVVCLFAIIIGRQRAQ